MPEKHLPLLGITIGDPAGIGPEIIVSGWSELASSQTTRTVVFGHPEILDLAAKSLFLPLEVVRIDIDELGRIGKNRPDCIPCVKCVDDSAYEMLFSVENGKGTANAAGGEAAYKALVTAIDAAKSGQIDAIVTAPLNKEALHKAGHFFPGHTEILAEKCGVEDFAMMLYLGPGSPLEGSGGLAVVHVTLHTAMWNIFEQITVESVLAKIRLADGFMRKIKRKSRENPRIGVCSLNPHAGEAGLFGDEEITTIRPAIELALAEGLDVAGPLPADTIMLKAKQGRFDAVVAMFHDQGHIALKLLDMQRSVNVTLGLPIIRTSVAHGTAFDIAWKGSADPGSLLEAARVAARLAER